MTAGLHPAKQTGRKKGTKMSQMKEQLQEARRGWMSILARSSRQALETAWEDLADRPGYSFLRRPETGLAMVRARAGSGGTRFNLGEMTVTRCAVQVGENVGHAYVAGRDERHAELAAVMDGLLQDERLRPALEESVIAPLRRNIESEIAGEARSVAATKVNFFTMVRGED